MALRAIMMLLRAIEKNLAAAGGFVDSLDDDPEELDEPAEA